MDNFSGNTPEEPDSTLADIEKNMFSEFIEEIDCKEIKKVSNLLSLLESLGTNPQPSYRTYVAGNTSS